VAIVETDKVTMDIRAKQAGVFLKGFVDKGAEVSVGADLYELDPEGTAAETPEAAESKTPTKATPKAETADSNTKAAPKAEASDTKAAPKAEAAASSSEGSPVEVEVPVMGESITTGVMASWLKKLGDSVGADEVVASIETDKVTVEVRSPLAGAISKIFAGEGVEVSVGEPLFVVTPGAASTSHSKEGASKPEASSDTSKEEASVYVETTQSKKAASEAKLSKVQEAPAPTPKPAAAVKPVAAVAGGARSETRVKMTRMRLRIAQRLKEAQNTTAMLTTFQEVKIIMSTYACISPCRNISSLVHRLI
jgi:2-oxoglutarate dehydrogenase E2 component (dihydrolipoamide succinyltransferase)